MTERKRGNGEGKKEGTRVKEVKGYEFYGLKKHLCKALHCSIRTYVHLTTMTDHHTTCNTGLLTCNCCGSPCIILVRMAVLN